MRSVVCTKKGFENVVLSTSEEVPTPGEFEILIRVLTAALNPVDWKRAEFDMGFPARLGLDYCGVVVKNGPKVDGSVFIENKSVVLVHGSLADSLRTSGLSEFAVHDTRYLTLIPEESIAKAADVDKLLVEIGSLPTAAYTAYQCVFTKLKLNIGGQLLNKKFLKNILVTAAAGGVGTFVLQYLNLWRQSLPQAQAQGIRIIATCSGKNSDYVKSLGATHVIDYTKDVLEEKIKEFTNNEMIDAWIELFSPESADNAYNFLNFGGEIVSIVGLSKAPDFRRALSAHLVALGFVYFTKRADIMSEIKSIGDIVLEWFLQGKIKTYIEEVVPFEDSIKALKKLKEGHTRGKLVVRVGKL